MAVRLESEELMREFFLELTAGVYHVCGIDFVDYPVPPVAGDAAPEREHS